MAIALRPNCLFSHSKYLDSSLLFFLYGLNTLYLCSLTENKIAKIFESGLVSFLNWWSNSFSKISYMIESTYQFWRYNLLKCPISIALLFLTSLGPSYISMTIWWAAPSRLDVSFLIFFHFKTFISIFSKLNKKILNL